MRRAVLLLLLIATGCSFYRTMSTYSLRSMVVKTSYYHARYIERCVTSRSAGVPCEMWRIDQDKLDRAAGEATDARKIGGDQSLQMNAFKKQLDVVIKGYAQWGL